MRHMIFCMENSYTNRGDKQTTMSKIASLNLLFKIKLHRFTWPFYPKALLSCTYNLIRVHDVAISCCSLVDSSATLKGRWSSTQDSTNNLWMRNWEWCGTLGYLSRIPSLKNEWSLNDFSPKSLISIIFDI